MSYCSNPSQTTRPILALHGSASSGAMWRPLVDALEGTRAVLTPDLPGYGTNAQVSELDAEARFGWLADVIHAIGGCFDLVGHSFGGAVALRLANQFPDLVSSVTLYEPILPPSRNISDCPEMQALWFVWTGMMRLDIDPAMARFCDFWSGPGSWDRLSERAQAKLKAEFSSVMLDFRQMFTGQLDVDEIAYTGPMILIEGDQSPDVAHAMGRRLRADYKQTSHRKLPGLGHLGPVTHPGMVVSAILETLGVSDQQASQTESLCV